MVLSHRRVTCGCLRECQIVITVFGWGGGEQQAPRIAPKLPKYPKETGIFAADVQGTHCEHAKYGVYRRGQHEYKTWDDPHVTWTVQHQHSKRQLHDSTARNGHAPVRYPPINDAWCVQQRNKRNTQAVCYQPVNETQPAKIATTSVTCQSSQPAVTASSCVSLTSPRRYSAQRLPTLSTSRSALPWRMHSYGMLLCTQRQYSSSGCVMDTSHGLLSVQHELNTCGYITYLRRACTVRAKYNRGMPESCVWCV